MKRRIQEELYEATKDLSADEFIAYMHQRIAQSQFAGFLEAPAHEQTRAPEQAP